MPIVSYILLFIGIIMFAIGLLYSNIQKSKVRHCNTRTTARVIEIEARINSNLTNGNRRSTTYHPVFEYDVKGEPLRKVYSIGTNPCKYAEGQTVTLLYDSEYPDSYLIEGDKTSNLLSVIVRLTGLFLLLLALVLYFI